MPHARLGWVAVMVVRGGVELRTGVVRSIRYVADREAGGGGRAARFDTPAEPLLTLAESAVGADYVFRDTSAESAGRGTVSETRMNLLSMAMLLPRESRGAHLG